MASNFRTFTITQARMGKPLQFQPPLGSKELEELVDAYVPGSASKQDKLSEVTLDFFTHATVDFSTGSLFRQYNVAISPNFTNHAFELSPTQTQSSGFSPPFFTPSPASSMTFADSGYGSISMTPPTRTHGAAGRVAKKSKKDTKKMAEARLPGFSIMTKDGIDVTSSAGRGTKTKEQREHAHLMRIMKACGDCKRKKVRCDPSHRRQQTDMSRSSTSTASSSSRPNPSPPVSVPSIARTSPDLPCFGNNALEDFVLFPEDNTSSWNPADMSSPEFDENFDLSQFNFDVSGMNNFSPLLNTANQLFDLSFTQQPVVDQSPQVADQYGLDQWASAQGRDLSVSHARPHYSLSSNDSSQLDSNFPDSGFLSTSESPDSGSFSTPQSQSLFAENFWPNGNGSISHPQVAQSSSVLLPTAEVDWSLLQSGINAMSSNGALSMNRRQRRKSPRLECARNVALQELIDRIPSANIRTGFVNSCEQYHDVPGPLSDSNSQSLGAAIGGSVEYWDIENGLEDTRALIAESMQALKSTPVAYQPIFGELQRLQVVLANLKSGDSETTPILRQALVPELEMLTSQLQVLLTRIKNMLRSSRESMQRHNRLDPESHPDHVRELSGQTNRLVSSLCTTINNLQTQDTGTGGITVASNPSILSSGNVQLALLPSSLPQTHSQDAVVCTPDGSYSSLSSGISSLINDSEDWKHSVLLRDGKTIIIDEEVYERDAFSAVAASNVFGNVAIATIDKLRFRHVTKPAVERLSHLVDGQSPPQVQLLQQEPIHTPAILTETILQRQQTIPSILAEIDQDFGLRRPILPPNLQILLAQNVRSSGNESHESISPGAIPVTVLEQRTLYNSGSDHLVNYIAILASLVLLNYVQATTFMLPIAAIFFAVPHLSPTIIAMVTMSVVVAQTFILSDLITVLRSFVTLGLMSAPLLRDSSTISNGSFGKPLSSSRRSLSTSVSNSKGTSPLSMFSELSLSIPAV